MESPYGAPQASRPGLPLWAWCLIVPCGCVVLVAAASPFLLMPVFTRARDTARTVSCMSNTKIQGAALLMYIQDYDNTYPIAQTWVDESFPYSKNDHNYRCPTVYAANSNDYGYAFNSKLSKKNQSTLASPETTIMTYDSTNLGRNATDPVTTLPSPPRHNDRSENMVGYADGHAKRIGGPASSPGR